MIKVFVSQPMQGRQQEAILRERKAIEAIIKTMFTGQDVYFIDSFIQGAKDVDPLFCLGHSLMALSKADIAVFAPGWHKSRGCKVEWRCCVEYGIRTCTINYDNLKEVTDDWSSNRGRSRLSL